MKLRITLQALFMITMVHLGFAQTTASFFEKTDGFLNTYVKDGKVAYQDIKANSSGLNELITMAEAISVSKSDVHTYQAFWINAYNLFVIKKKYFLHRYEQN